MIELDEHVAECTVNHLFHGARDNLWQGDLRHTAFCTGKGNLLDQN